MLLSDKYLTAHNGGTATVKFSVTNVKKMTFETRNRLYSQSQERRDRKWIWFTCLPSFVMCLNQHLTLFRKYKFNIPKVGFYVVYIVTNLWLRDESYWVSGWMIGFFNAFFTITLNHNQLKQFKINYCLRLAQFWLDYNCILF
jgi:hypothetical protein